MTEPFELIDETELLFYEIIRRQLDRQKARIDANTSLVFNDAFWDSEELLISAAVVPFLTGVVDDALRLTLADLPSVVNVDAILADAELFAQQIANKFIGQINNTTRNGVGDALVQAVTDQNPLSEIEEKIDSFFSDERVRRIAITETTNTYIGASDLAVTQLTAQGIDVVQVWRTVNDSHVCQVCMLRDGKERGDGWYELEAAHVGCRCFVTLEIRE